MKLYKIKKSKIDKKGRGFMQQKISKREQKLLIILEK